MIELKKLEMVLESILDIATKTTSGNVAHRIATIRHQASYGLEQLAKIRESENEITQKK